jgi:hypothetical protein
MPGLMRAVGSVKGASAVPDDEWGPVARRGFKAEERWYSHKRSYG